MPIVATTAVTLGVELRLATFLLMLADLIVAVAVIAATNAVREFRHARGGRRRNKKHNGGEAGFVQRYIDRALPLAIDAPIYDVLVGGIRRAVNSRPTCQWPIYFETCCDHCCVETLTLVSDSVCIPVNIFESFNLRHLQSPKFNFFSCSQRPTTSAS